MFSSAMHTLHQDPVSSVRPSFSQRKGQQVGGMCREETSHCHSSLPKAPSEAALHEQS